MKHINKLRTDVPLLAVARAVQKDTDEAYARLDERQRTANIPSGKHNMVKSINEISELRDQWYVLYSISEHLNRLASGN